MLVASSLWASSWASIPLEELASSQTAEERSSARFVQWFGVPRSAASLPHGACSSQAFPRAVSASIPPSDEINFNK